MKNEAGISWKYYFFGLPFPFLYKSVLEEATDVILGRRSLESTAYVQHIVSTDQFTIDAERGELPQVCYIEPARGIADDHPSLHIQLGQGVIAGLYQTLAQSPQWDKSVFIVTYDEHGGFYDHVPPPTTDDDFVDLGFDRLGFRVPALIAGPYIREGFVDHTTYDHASWIAFVRRLYGLEPLSRRDAAAAPIVNAFDPARVLAGTPRAAPTMPEVVFDPDTFNLGCLDPSLLPPTPLQVAANRGMIPHHWDRRATVWNQLGTLFGTLERAGGTRRG